MARPLRVEFEGQTYHITSRGNDRQTIYRDDRDRLRFLDTLGECARRFGLVVHAYCLMPNHYHLVISTPRGNLSQAMAWLQGTYCVRYNRRHGRSGHVVQGRFKAHLVEADAYARRLVRYVHLNPVRPKDRKKIIPPDRRKHLEAYRWSSHRVYAGTLPERQTPDWLNTQWLAYWGGGKDTGARARKAYAADVAGCFGEMIESPFIDLRASLVLGGQKLWQRATELLGQNPRKPESRFLANAGETAVREHVRTLLADEPDPRVCIWARVRLAGERLADLARELKYSDSSGVSRAASRLETQDQNEPALKQKLDRFRSRMSNVKL